jgi:hypothetical protein
MKRTHKEVMFDAAVKIASLESRVGGTVGNFVAHYEDAITKITAERDAALADNATFIDWLRSWAVVPVEQVASYVCSICAGEGNEIDEVEHSSDCMLSPARPHPGSAMLTQLKRYKEALKPFANLVGMTTLMLHDGETVSVKMGDIRRAARALEDNT